MARRSIVKSRTSLAVRGKSPLSSGAGFMRHLRIHVALGIALIGLATMVLARQQPQGEPFSTSIRQVKDGLYVIPGYDGAVTGGNVAVRVTSEGAIIVDDRLPPSSAEIASKVKSVTPQPIKYVLSTHNHGDHTGGHAEFIKTAEARATGATRCSKASPV